METPTRPTPKGGSVSAISGARELRELMKARPELATRVLELNPDDVLVREGELAEHEGYLVRDGVLAEEQTHFVTAGAATGESPRRGHTVFTLCEIEPGGIAYVQGLTGFADQPAFTTIRARTSATVFIITPDWIRRVDPMVAKLLSAEMRIRRQMLQALTQIRLQSMLDERLAFIADRARVTHPDTTWTHERLIATLISSLTSYARMESERARAMEDARAAREGMRDALDAFTQERSAMEFRAVGAELYLDRVRNELKARGLPDTFLSFTPIERTLLLGERPEDATQFAALMAAARQQREEPIQLDEYELVGILQESPPPPVPALGRRTLTPVGMAIPDPSAYFPKAPPLPRPPPRQPPSVTMPAGGYIEPPKPRATLATVSYGDDGPVSVGSPTPVHSAATQEEELELELEPDSSEEVPESEFETYPDSSRGNEDPPNPAPRATMVGPPLIRI